MNRPFIAGHGKALSFAGGICLLAAIMVISLGLGQYPISPKEIMAFLGQSWFGASWFTDDQMDALKTVSRSG
jgi:hypothetical protein